jgi:glycine/D-amino acid oxidase-like deaminating enzyme
MRETADIVIVGAGALGCSAAYHLGSMGAKNVLVLDRGAICSGETRKSGGFVQSHWMSLDEVRLIHKSRELFLEWEETFGEGCSYVKNGYLHVTGEENEATVRRTHEMLLAEGIESHWLEPRDIKRLQPICHVRDLTGAAWEPQSGWADPVAAIRSMAKGAQSKGVEIAEGVTVLQIAHRGGKIVGVETDKGFISTGTVVLCAGPWTPLLHPLPSVPLPIRAKRGQVCYINRPGGLPKVELAFYDEITGLYTHPAGDTNLLGIDFNFDDIWDPNRYNQQIDEEYIQDALGALGYRFPVMCGAHVVKGVVGLYDFTPDGHPIIDGPIGLEGYYVCAGFSGIGFKSSPMTGLGLAELVYKGKPESVDLDFLSFSRFRDSDHWIGWD